MRDKDFKVKKNKKNLFFQLNEWPWQAYITTHLFSCGGTIVAEVINPLIPDAHYSERRDRLAFLQ